MRSRLRSARSTSWSTMPAWRSPSRFSSRTRPIGTGWSTPTSRARSSWRRPSRGGWWRAIPSPSTAAASSTSPRSSRRACSASLAPYAAAKGGLWQVTRSMALELARHGIRVNALAPGYIETEINRDFLAGPGGERMRQRIPQRRFGAPDDLDGALLLLASDASRYMTGSILSSTAASCWRDRARGGPNSLVSACSNATVAVMQPHPWLKPLYRRVLTTLVCLAWVGFESLAGDGRDLVLAGGRRHRLRDLGFLSVRQLPRGLRRSRSCHHVRVAEPAGRTEVADQADVAHQPGRRPTSAAAPPAARRSRSPAPRRGSARTDARRTARSAPACRRSGIGSRDAHARRARARPAGAGRSPPPARRHRAASSGRDGRCRCETADDAAPPAWACPASRRAAHRARRAAPARAGPRARPRTSVSSAIMRTANWSIA